MKFEVYESKNSSNAKFIFWTQEDLNRINNIGGLLETPEAPPGERLAVIELIKELDLKYLAYNNVRKVGNIKTEEYFNPNLPNSVTPLPPITTPFLPADKNLYFVFGTGYLRIVYDDGTIQTVDGQYTSESWTEYQDIWQYDKNCYCELIGDVKFIHLSLEQGKVRSNYSVKAASLNSLDGSLKTLTHSVNNPKNYSLIASPQFNFNAVTYSEFDRPKGVYKWFNDQKGFTLRTNGHASAIYLEEL